VPPRDTYEAVARQLGGPLPIFASSSALRWQLVASFTYNEGCPAEDLRDHPKLVRRDYLSPLESGLTAMD
jgi:hypothetical protein